jgi:hypothetical protein
MVDSSESKSFTSQFSFIGIFLLLVFSITLGIIGAINASNYNTILVDSNGDNTIIGVGRGSLIWYYWLNVILSILSFLAALYFAYRLLFKGSITQNKTIKKLNAALGAEATGYDEFYKNQVAKNCEVLGIEGDTNKGDCSKYIKLDDDKKVDFYIEKQNLNEPETVKFIKESLCKNVSGSKCNKRIKAFGDAISKS